MSIEKLLQLNVNEHVEKKNNLSYLSWAWAWAEALKADSAATFKVETFEEHGQHGSKRTVPYMSINGSAMVCVTVTMFGKPMTCHLPVMDYKNKAIQEPDAFAVNTAIMRCMTKALALHGLGLYIFSGEDLPEQSDVSRKGPGPVVTPRGASQNYLSNDEKESIQNLAESIKDLYSDGRALTAKELYKAQQLEAEQEIYLFELLPSNIRSNLKAK